MAESIDPQISAQAQIAVLTELVSDLMNRLIYAQTTIRAMAISRERERRQPEQGDGIA